MLVVTLNYSLIALRKNKEKIYLSQLILRVLTQNIIWFGFESLLRPIQLFTDILLLYIVCIGRYSTPSKCIVN